MTGAGDGHDRKTIHTPRPANNPARRERFGRTIQGRRIFLKPLSIILPLMILPDGFLAPSQTNASNPLGWGERLREPSSTFHPLSSINFPSPIQRTSDTQTRFAITRV
jgi:hypothetical protein